MLPLIDRTTAEVQFDMVDDYFKHHNIDWKNCYKVITDGCPSMMGQRKGFGMLGLSTLLFSPLLCISVMCLCVKFLTLLCISV